MEWEQAKRFESALLNFVERASGKEATAEEVQALAAVARVIAEIWR